MVRRNPVAFLFPEHKKGEADSRQPGPYDPLISLQRILQTLTIYENVNPLKTLVSPSGFEPETY